MLRDGMEAPSISLEGREVLCPMGRAVGLLATAWRSLSGGLEAYAAELVTQANLEMAAFGAYEDAGREALGRHHMFMKCIEAPRRGPANGPCGRS